MFDLAVTDSVDGYRSALCQRRTRKNYLFESVTVHISEARLKIFENVSRPEPILHRTTVGEVHTESTCFNFVTENAVVIALRRLSEPNSPDMVRPFNNTTMRNTIVRIGSYTRDVNPAFQHSITFNRVATHFTAGKTDPHIRVDHDMFEPIDLTEANARGLSVIGS